MGEFKYDVFISHSSKDKPAVRELATRLEKDSLRIWFDEWVIEPGDLIALSVQNGIQESQRLILVMSPNASESDWANFESLAAVFRDPLNKAKRFLPLLLQDTKISDTLNQIAYIDWRNKDEFE